MIFSALRRALVPLFAGALMASFGSAALADTLGRSTIGTTQSSGLRADFKRGSKFTLTKPGTLRELCAYVDGQAAGAGPDNWQDFNIAIYRDSGGVPAALVAQTSDPMFVETGDSARWRCGSTEYVPLTPAAYWIVIHTGNAHGDSVPLMRYYADGTGNWYGNADEFSDGASLQFGPGGTGNGTLSVYATFAPETQLKSSGRTTIGTIPSGALRADFKRGSSFTLSQAGRLMSITGYFDGLGGASGTQRVRLVLYKDQGGVPGAYVTETLLVVWAGMPAQWMSGIHTPPVMLTAGKYWIALHTDGPPIARYYADGTGNWYGNPDVYDGGPSNPFGAGGTGNGTISAFISYEPGPFVTSTIGSQAPGTPQRVLSDGFLQGSQFVVPSPGNTVVTGLNAYVDGLGGASGTQRIKLVVMHGSVVHGVSEEVSIPAGMSARWVHFPMPPVRLIFPEHSFMVFSGGAAGVARVYGSSGSGLERGIHYNPAQYGPPSLLASDELDPNNVSYSLYGNVQLQAN
jgi:hypothetical protein